MKVMKCDLCGATAEAFVQIKFRRVEGEKASGIKQIDVCTECQKKHFKKLPMS